MPDRVDTQNRPVAGPREKAKELQIPYGLVGVKDHGLDVSIGRQVRGSRRNLEVTVTDPAERAGAPDNASSGPR
jgi:hypothetical protein